MNWAHHSTRGTMGTRRVLERRAPGLSLPTSVRIVARQGRGGRRSMARRPRCLRPPRQWLVSQLLTAEASARKLGILPVHPAQADEPRPPTRARARRLVSMAQADMRVLTLVRVGLHLSAFGRHCPRNHQPPPRETWWGRTACLRSTESSPARATADGAPPRTSRFAIF